MLPARDVLSGGPWLCQNLVHFRHVRRSLRSPADGRRRGASREPRRRAKGRVRFRAAAMRMHPSVQARTPYAWTCSSDRQPDRRLCDPEGCALPETFLQIGLDTGLSVKASLRDFEQFDVLPGGGRFYYPPPQQCAQRHSNAHASPEFGANARGNIGLLLVVAVLGHEVPQSSRELTEACRHARSCPSRTLRILATPFSARPMGEGDDLTLRSAAERGISAPLLPGALGRGGADTKPLEIGNIGEL